MPTERLDIIVTERGTRRVRRSLLDIGQDARRSAGGVSFLQAALASLGSGLVLRRLQETADAYQLLQNRLRIVTSSQAELTSVTRELLRISNETFTKFEGNAELFSRIAFSTRELNASYEDLLTFQELINKSIIASGASVKEASAGLIQFSQGLASGTLRGDELRAVLEQLPFVADVIAKELGVTRGELRLLGEEGQITAEVILNSFLRAEETIDELFSRIDPTISQSFQVLSNSFTEFLGEFDRASGISRVLSNAIFDLAENIETLARVVGAAGLTGALLLARAAVIGLNAAIAANPIGFLLTGLTAGVSLLVTFSDRIRLSEDGLANLGDVAVVVFGRLGRGIREARVLFGELFSFLGIETGTLFDDVDLSIRGLVTRAARNLDLFAAVWVGTFNTIVDVFNQLPQIIVGLVTEAFNGVVSAQEIVINGVITVLNTLVRRATGPIETLANLFITTFNVANTVIASTLNSVLQGIESLVNFAIDEINRLISRANALPGVNIQGFGRVALPDIQPPELADLVDISEGDLDVSRVQLNRIPQLFGEELENASDVALQNILDAAASNTFAADYVDGIFDEAERRAQERAARPDEDLANLAETFLGGGTLSNAVTRQISELNAELTQQVDLLRLTAEQREVNSRLIEITNDLVEDGLNLEARLTAEQQANLQNILSNIEDADARATLDAIANSLGGVRDASLSLTEAQAELNRQVQLGNIDIEQATVALQALELQELSLIQAQLRRAQVIAQVADVLDEVRGPVIDLERAQRELNIQLARGFISLTEYQRALATLQNLALTGELTIGAGLIRGVNEVFLEAQDSATLVEESVVRAFNNMEDAIVDFATTGRLSFRNLVDSIIGDVTRLAVRQAITLPLTNLFNFGGLFPARQAGGFVSPGQTYLVGERGPELFTPSNGGRIDSNAQTQATSRSGGTTIIMNISTPDADSFRRSRRQVADAVSGAIRQGG